MKNGKNSSIDTAVIRRRAEEQQKDVEQETSLPYEQQNVQKLLHELQVHEIELKMQNEELMRAQSEVEAGLERYTDLYDFAPIAYFTLDREGIIQRLNLEGAKLLGMHRSSLVNRYMGVLVSHETRSLFNAFLAKVFESHIKETSELVLMSESGDKINVQIGAIISGDESDCLITVMDITERKQAEAKRQVVLDMLRLINVPNDSHEIIRSVIDYLRNWTGCEAVGIRMRDGDDYPYYDSRGFTGKFVIVHNQLRQLDENGVIINDSGSSPFLERMCGNILAGIFDPKKPFSTSYGSFWTNDMTDLLANSLKADRKIYTCNRDDSECYESLALIPLRFNGEVIGLIQFHDILKGKFTPDMIGLVERLSENIAGSLMENQAKQDLKKSRRLLQSIIASTTDAIYVKDPQGRYTLFNTAAEKVFGKCATDVLGKDDSVLFPPSEASAIMENDHKTMKMAVTTTIEETTTDTSGRCSTYLSTKGPLYDEDGRSLGVFGISRDITEHVQIEEEKQEFYRNTIKSVTQGKIDIVSYEEIEAYVDPTGLISTVVSPLDSTIARCSLLGFYMSKGFTNDKLGLFEAAVGEAITNAINHANGCLVYAGASDEFVWAAIVDKGDGISNILLPKAILRRGFSSKVSMGMGYTIMMEGTNNIKLCTGSNGTTIVLTVNIKSSQSAPSLDDYPDMWDDIPNFG